MNAATHDSRPSRRWIYLVALAALATAVLVFVLLSALEGDSGDGAEGTDDLANGLFLLLEPDSGDVVAVDDEGDEVTQFEGANWTQVVPTRRAGVGLALSSDGDGDHWVWFDVTNGDVEDLGVQGRVAVQGEAFAVVVDPIGEAGLTLVSLADGDTTTFAEGSFVSPELIHVVEDESVLAFAILDSEPRSLLVDTADPDRTVEVDGIVVDADPDGTRFLVLVGDDRERALVIVDRQGDEISVVVDDTALTGAAFADDAVVYATDEELVRVDPDGDNADSVAEIDPDDSIRVLPGGAFAVATDDDDNTRLIDTVTGDDNSLDGDRVIVTGDCLLVTDNQLSPDDTTTVLLDAETGEELAEADGTPASALLVGCQHLVIPLDDGDAAVVTPDGTTRLNDRVRRLSLDGELYAELDTDGDDPRIRVLTIDGDERFERDGLPLTWLAS